jgi:hypothetical protein
MAITGKLTTPVAHPRTSARRKSLRAYSADFLRLVTVARESGIRFQRQWILLFISGLFALTLVAGLYLNVTARAAIAGREIQNIEAEITINERANADLETKIAILLSNQALEERARAMGFEPIDRTTLQYMVVPGYFPAQAVTMVMPVAQSTVLRSSPEFKETLIDWVEKQLEAASIPLTQVKR